MTNQVWKDLECNGAERGTISESASDAFEHHVSRHSVGLFFQRSVTALENASGIAVRWRYRRLIVTAAHVFPSGEEGCGITLILPRDRPLLRGDAVETLPPQDLDCIVPISNAPIVRCDSPDVDLALFEVDSEFGRASDVEFYDLPEFATAPPSGTPCLLSGFPADLSNPISADEAVVRLANRWSAIAEESDSQKFLKDFDPNLHLLMKFRRADKGKHPGGFSGGGVWFPLRRSSESQLWRAVPGLAGIQSTWYSRPELTKAVRVERVVEFLQKIFP